MILSYLYLTVSGLFMLFTDPVGGAAKQKDTDAQLQERLRQLNEMTDHQTVIRMNGKKFDSFIKTQPRNYSVIAMLTTLQSHRQCQVCRQAKDEFEIVAYSWRYGTSFTDSVLFFCMLDYDDAPDAFSYLNINSVPQFVHFPAKGKLKRYDTMDVYRVGFSASAIARFVVERTKIEIKINRPPDYTNTIILAALFVFITGLVYVKRKNLEFFYNKAAWGGLTLSILLLMTSGQMWNHIHGPPFMEKDPQSGTTVYVHPYSDSQFVAETYIVFGINAAIVAGFILLTEVRTMKFAVTKKRVITICALLSVVFFFSLVLSIFRAKYHGYPYRFLLQ